MLIWIDENKKITAYNTVLSELNAQKYLSDRCIWIDAEMPRVECSENKKAEFYLNDNNGISVLYVNTETEPTEQEFIQAELLLNQAEIIAKQNEHDEVLAEILLGQQEANGNV